MNIATTAWLLAQKRRQAGSWPRAFELYNAGKVGTPAGSAYSNRVQQRQQDWHRRLS